ncbi:uncharacterized protein EI90DRAFT_3115297 [Cantharellus anzutake]|uniref:uncharacterized protein n=1 Tax=Cantharellus anzutake TaxID=1750568 RepID=UPI00190512B9|nr:uncharacterized protein EI90DRAFT_3115297 [Cantharellus anzutake]KAF8342747.1 hypothetical protein EI90DRAFT_3115297 [Cantharellus anzutake]
MLFELLSLLGGAASRPYAVPFILICFILYAIRLWSNGPRNPRNRNMHGRVVVITGGFSPLGLRLITELAKRGAQVIGLTPSLDDPVIDELIHAIRAMTKNELVYAEECDLDSPASIHSFCKQLVQLKPSLDGGSPAEPQRVDALIFAHEYSYIARSGSSPLADSAVSAEKADERRLRPSLASFLLTASILPSLLRAPKDRDIRIIHVVNPFYAAAVPFFNPSSPSPALELSVFAKEGYRSLRTVIYGRHLQRVLDAIARPKKDSAPAGKGGLVVPPKIPGASNILSITVSPGFIAREAGDPLLSRFWNSPLSPLWLMRVILYYVLVYPIVVILTKSTFFAVESILYMVFLPHPRKMLPAVDDAVGAHSNREGDADRTVEGGKLYRDYTVVRLPGGAEESIMDNEGIGRAVWEHLEAGVQRWETEEAEILAQAVKNATAGSSTLDPRVRNDPDH